MSGEVLSAGALREALVDAMDLGGAWGENLHESKQFLLSVDGRYYPLAQASVAFVAGRFALVLTAGEAQ